jgi:hypothetical protein
MDMAKVIKKQDPKPEDEKEKDFTDYSSASDDEKTEREQQYFRNQEYERLNPDYDRYEY